VLRPLIARPAFRFPALKSLGELAAREPVIVVDTRERELHRLRGYLV
jgi:hypothetical protein